MTPTNKEINEVLDKLEQPKWQSDADRLGLPLATTTSGSGAPKLDVDKVLRHSGLDKLRGKK